MRRRVSKALQKVGKRTFNNACKSVPSVDRKNVSKYLIRNFLRDFKNNFHKYHDYCVDTLHIDRNYFRDVKEAFNEVLFYERKRESKNYIKDYAEILDIMLGNLTFNEILKLRLRELLEKFKIKEYGRIKECNHENVIIK